MLDEIVGQHVPEPVDVAVAHYNDGNRGGDEIPTSNGVPNPGGNNHPGA